MGKCYQQYSHRKQVSMRHLQQAYKTFLWNKLILSPSVVFDDRGRRKAHVIKVHEEICNPKEQNIYQKKGHNHAHNAMLIPLSGY
jgi:hypothetical protein